MAARKYDLYRVEVGVGPKGRQLLGSWQVDDVGNRRARSIYPIAEEITAYDSRDVDLLVRAARRHCEGELRELLEWAHRERDGWDSAPETGYREGRQYSLTLVIERAERRLRLLEQGPAGEGR